jgi:hypothetical protein
MWWCEAEAAARAGAGRRRALGLLAGLCLAAPLAGCFRPMLAADGPSGALRGRVVLPDFQNRFGYYLNDSLRDRLGRPEAAEYRLAVKTRLVKDDLAIAQDNAVTRISLTATAEWALYRIVATQGQRAGAADDADPVLSGRTVSQSGYNSTASLFATRAAKLDIERRLARDLGERIARTLFARAGRLAAGPGAQAAPAES